MAWTSGFLWQASQGTIYPLFLLESVPIGSVSALGGDLKLSSFPTTHYTHAISRQGSRISWGSLTPGSWSISFGSLSLALLPGFDVRPYTQRGQVVELRVGFVGQKLSDFEAVWLGQVSNFKFTGSQWVLECVELTSALNSRFSLDGTEVDLFNDLSSTTLAENFDPEATTPELEVVDASNFERSESAGDRYCLLVTPTKGKPFYVLADTLTGNVFSDLTFGERPGSPLLGTIAYSDEEDEEVEAQEGDSVKECAYTRGHPIRMVRRLLESSGTASGGSAGDNGLDDVLPETWGYNLRERYIDVEDSQFYLSEASPASGPVEWTIVASKPQQDPLGWLLGWLAQGGFFLTLRQGRITCRAVLRSWERMTPGFERITDADIAPGTIRYETYDSQSPIEYANSQVIAFIRGYGSATLTEAALDSRPNRRYRTRQLELDFQSENNPADGNLWAEEVVERIGVYDTRVPERLSLQTMGLRCAGIAIGDIVEVDSAYVPTARGVRDQDTSRRWLVVGGGPDWFNGFCEWELISIPAVANEV